MSDSNTTAGFNNESLSLGQVSNETSGVTSAQNDFKSLQDIMYGVQYVVMPILMVFGFLGNSLTIVTMSSRKFNHLTSRLILIALAVSDTLLLLTQPFNKIWIIKLIGSDLRAISDLSCKIFFVIFKAAKMTSSWFVVLLCVERYVAVRMPLKSKLILKKEYIIAAIFTNYAFLLIYNGVWSFSSMVVNGFCRNDIPSTEFNYFLIGACAIYSIIPTIILFALTPQIVMTLVKQRRVQQNLTGGSQSSVISRRNERMFRASVMLIAVMTAYVILVIPITTVHLYAFYNQFNAFLAITRHYFIYREVAQILEQLNYSINFVFYVICSRHFREHLLEIIGIKRCACAIPEKSPLSLEKSKATEEYNVSCSDSRLELNKSYTE